MNRSFSKSAAARLAVIVVALLMVLMVGTTGPVGAQDAPVPQVSVEAPSAIVEASPTPAATVPQVSVEAPSATPEVIVQTAEQAEVLTVNGVSVMSTDPTIDESGWVECRQTSGTQSACQGRVERKLGRLGFALPDWTDPDGAVQYMSGLRYENRPDKEVISNCTRQMAAKWSEGSCWVHPSPTATQAPTETPEPTATNTPSPTATATVTNTPEPTATGTLLPTATSTSMPTATATATVINTPTATATVQAPTVTPTPGDPWVGHTLTLGSFCSPIGAQDSPVGQAPGEPIPAYVGAYIGATHSTNGDWWGGDVQPNGWTQTTTLSYGQAPRVWSYATSVDQPLLGWYFIDPASGEVAQAAPDSAIGFQMGGERDSKWLASLHECSEPAVLAVYTPVPTPSGEQPADLRKNGGGESIFNWLRARPFTTGIISFVAFIILCLVCIRIQESIDARKRAKLAETEEGR